MSTVARYRKKPVVVDAMRWDGDVVELSAFVGSRNWGRADAHDVPWNHEDDGHQVVIWNEPEQAWIPCPLGHRVIAGVQREYYPCDSDIFDATYELVEPS